MKSKYYQNHLRIKDILLATDNSAAVAPAEIYAIELAAYLKCQLHIIHFVEAEQGITKEHISFDEYALQYIHQKQNQMEVKFRHLLGPKKVTGKFVVKIKEGTVAKSILDYATSNTVDCVVAGSHGSSGYKNNSFGSVVHELIKEKIIPLFIIPQLGIFRKFSKVAMACKGNTSEVRLLGWLTKALYLPIRDIYLLHVSADDNISELKHFEKQIADSFGEDKIPLYYISDTNVDQGLNQYCLEKKIDLLALAGEPKSFFQKLFSPNIVSRLNYHIQLPLLYLPNYE